MAKRPCPARRQRRHAAPWSVLIHIQGQDEKCMAMKYVISINRSLPRIPLMPFSRRWA